MGLPGGHSTEGLNGGDTVSQLAEHIRRQEWRQRLQAAADDVEFWADLLGLAEESGAILRPFQQEFLDACAAYERLWLEYSLSLPGGTDE